MKLFPQATEDLKELLQFGMVGSVGFLVDSGALTLFILLGLNPYNGRLVSFFIAVSCTWLLNRSFTFKAKRTSLYLSEWIKYIIANSLGAMLNYGVYVLLLYKVALAVKWPVLGVAVGSLIGLFANYLNSRLFVFRKKAELK